MEVTPGHCGVKSDQIQAPTGAQAAGSLSDGPDIALLDHTARRTYQSNFTNPDMPPWRHAFRISMMFSECNPM